MTRPRTARIARSDRSARGGIPEATVSRLPLYLQALTGLAERGVATVSSEELAAAAGVGSAKLRKDLSHLGSYGTRGVGYEVEYLVYQISRELGLTQDWRVVIVGVGNLGHALANYNGFTSRGFTVAALVDAAPEVAGTSVAGMPVLPLGELEDVVARLEIQIGVVATPADVAQQVVDRMVTAGVTGVLNFAPCVLSVPDGVMVRRVDLSTELQILAFHEQRRAAGELTGESDVARTGTHGASLSGVPGGSPVNGVNGTNGTVNGPINGQASGSMNGVATPVLARDRAGDLTTPPARAARSAGAAG